MNCLVRAGVGTVGWGFLIGGPLVWECGSVGELGCAETLGMGRGAGRMIGSEALKQHIKVKRCDEIIRD